MYTFPPPAPALRGSSALLQLILHGIVLVVLGGVDAQGDEHVHYQQTDVDKVSAAQAAGDLRPR